MPADVLKVVIRWFVEEVLNTGNLKAVDELFAPDYVAHVPLDPEPLRGVPAWKQRVTTYLAAFPDLHITLEELIAEKDIVVARVTWSGTQRKRFLGVSATNRRVAVAGVFAWRIVDGKICEEWIAEDLLSLMQQLGALPERLLADCQVHAPIRRGAPARSITRLRGPFGVHRKLLDRFQVAVNHAHGARSLAHRDGNPLSGA